MGIIKKYREIKRRGRKDQFIARILGSYIGALKRGVTHDEAVVSSLEHCHIIDSNNKEEVLNNLRVYNLYDSIDKVAPFLAGVAELEIEGRLNVKTLSELLTEVHEVYRKFSATNRS
ncbi:MAG: hypothetical protein ABSH06_09055 [Thermodesulfobacteriota bacterium]|jgi:hypothetical protein